MSAFVQTQPAAAGNPSASANAAHPAQVGQAATDAATIDFELDGRAVQASRGETIWQVARRVGIEIPHLCHREGLDPAGNCRACVVEVKGERVLAAACCRAPQAALAVRSDTARGPT